MRALSSIERERGEIYELERERPGIRAGNGEAKDGQRSLAKRERHVGHDFSRNPMREKFSFEEYKLSLEMEKGNVKGREAGFIKPHLSDFGSDIPADLFSLIIAPITGGFCISALLWM